MNKICKLKIKLSLERQYLLHARKYNKDKWIITSWFINQYRMHILCTGTFGE